MSKLRVKSSFPTAASPYSLCLIHTVLTPVPLLSPGACQISSSFKAVPVKPSFLISHRTVFQCELSFSVCVYRDKDVRLLMIKLAQTPLYNPYIAQIEFQILELY